MSAAQAGTEQAGASLEQVAMLDQTNRADHFYLTQADHCRFLTEYHGGGYRAGRLNQLIVNFKCRPSIAQQNAARLWHKRRAIGEIAAALRNTVTRQAVESATWVPIPPSEEIGAVDYDDRLQQTLAAAFRGYDLDLRLLLRQTCSMPADHKLSERAPATALYQTLLLDTTALTAQPLRERIILFDDILTTGKHYKCCERRLREALPRIPICGWFVARRILPRRWRSVPDEMR